MCKEDEHDWEDLGYIISYPKNSPIMPCGQPYEGYMLVNKNISVLLCSKCGKIELRFNPWERILENESQET